MGSSIIAGLVKPLMAGPEHLLGSKVVCFPCRLIPLPGMKSLCGGVGGAAQHNIMRLYALVGLRSLTRFGRMSPFLREICSVRFGAVATFHSIRGSSGAGTGLGSRSEWLGSSA